MAYTYWTDGDGFYMKDTANHYWKAGISTTGTLTWTDTGTGVPAGSKLDATTHNAAMDTVLADAKAADVSTDLSPQADGLGLISGAVALNLSGLDDVAYAAKLNGNTTITVSNLARFVPVMFRIVQPTSGVWTVTFAITGGTVRRPSGDPPTLTPAPNAIDYYAAIGSPTAVNMDLFIVGTDVR